MSAAPLGAGTAGIPKRACLYLRTSTATRSRHGDVLAYDQDPAVRSSHSDSWPRSGAGLSPRSTLTEPVVRKSAAPAWTLSCPMPGVASSTWLLYSALIASPAP